MFHKFLRIWSHLLKKFLMENFIFWAVICPKFGIPNPPQSPDIGKNSDRGISHFLISGQSFIKENCHNSRTSDDFDKKPEPVTKLYKR